MAKVTEPREVSSGTLRAADLIESFMEVLEEVNKDAYDELILQYNDDVPPYAKCGHMDWQLWEKNSPPDADYFLNEVLMDVMNEQSGDGLYFGAHEGNGSLFGWWRTEVDLISIGYEFTCPSCHYLNKVMEVRESYTCQNCDVLLYTNEYHHAHG